MKKIIVLATLIALAGCDQSKPNGMKERKFASMDECLTSIKESSNSNLHVITDKPDHVGDRLTANGEDQDLVFACEVKETGTEGTYVYAFYETPPKA